MNLRLGKKRRGKPLLERIADLSMPEPNSGCWIWIGAVKGRDKDHEYGMMMVDGRPRSAHRMACEAVRGPISDELVVDHLCRNSICVNPDHLEPVTLSQNQLRSPLKFGEFCLHGHERTAENTYVVKNGWRRCKVCHNAHRRWSYRELRV